MFCCVSISLYVVFMRLKLILVGAKNERIIIRRSFVKMQLVKKKVAQYLYFSLWWSFSCTSYLVDIVHNIHKAICIIAKSATECAATNKLTLTQHHLTWNMSWSGRGMRSAPTNSILNRRKHFVPHLRDRGTLSIIQLTKRYYFLLGAGTESPVL